jgi:hypothetical protein
LHCFRLTINLLEVPSLKESLWMTVPMLFGPYGSASLDYADCLVQFGANALWFHGFDPKAFESCAKYGLAACVEFKTFRADFHIHPELIPIGVDGKPIRFGELVQGICLSKKDFLAQIREDLLAGLRTYQPAGIWLDYLTYAGWFETPEPDLQESCFCSGCMADFCEATGTDAVTPAAILKNHGDAWTRYKCERIAAFAAHYAEIIRSHLPSCTIGAYMCPWSPAEYDGALHRIFAQDYELMAPAIDIFTPLIYAQKSGRPTHWGRYWLEQAGGFIPANRKVQLILDMLDFPESLLAVTDSSQPSWGLQLFGGAEVFSQPDRARLFQRAVRQIREAIS